MLHMICDTEVILGAFALNACAPSPQISRLRRNGTASHRVPKECPAWIAELITACMLEDPVSRPTSQDIYRLLMEGNDELL